MQAFMFDVILAWVLLVIIKPETFINYNISNSPFFLRQETFSQNCKKAYRVIQLFNCKILQIVNINDCDNIIL